MSVVTSSVQHCHNNRGAPPRKRPTGMKLEYKTSKQLFKNNDAGIQNKQTVARVQ